MSDLHESAYSVCQEAMAILREEQTLNKNCILYGQDPATGTATRTPNKVEAACRRMYENARHDILDSHSWSFCKKDIYVRSTQDKNGRWVTPYPGVADIKILACYTDDWNKAEWTVRGRERILSSEPINNIVYLEESEDVDEWPRLVRTALVFKLASMLAIEITGRAADVDSNDKLANSYIQKARTDDARQSGTGTGVYGRNYLFDVATGKRRAKFLNGARI